MKKVLKSFAVAGYIAVCSMLMFGVTANAYIDPSVMTYLIQAVAGVIIAVGAAIGIYWHRAKKKVYKTLNIDENRNKEVESNNIEIK